MPKLKSLLTKKNTTDIVTMSLSQSSNEINCPYFNLLKLWGPMTDYSTKRISQVLLAEVAKSLRSIDAYGSVEIYVQNKIVTQISVRNIKKTNGFESRTSQQKNK